MGQMERRTQETSNQQTNGGFDRRALLRRAAVAGAVGWTAPVILTSEIASAGVFTAKCAPGTTTASASFTVVPGGCTSSSSAINITINFAGHVAPTSRTWSLLIWKNFSLTEANRKGPSARSGVEFELRLGSRSGFRRRVLEPDLRRRLRRLQSRGVHLDEATPLGALSHDLPTSPHPPK